MSCNHCGAQVDQLAKFCPKCGKALLTQGGSCTAAANTGAHPLQQRFFSLLVDANEKVVSVLGNSFVRQFLSTGVLGNGFAVLTDKRVYFKGKCIYRNNKWLRYQQEERTVDAKDITSTGFVHNKCLWALIACIIMAVYTGLETLFFLFSATDKVFEEPDPAVTVPLIFTIWLLIAFYLIYKSQTRSLFEISFAGGRISFDLRWFSLAEAQEFQKQIVRVKQDAQQAEKPNTFPANLGDLGGNVIEQLERAAELYRQGKITLEQYEQLKNKLLNG